MKKKTEQQGETQNDYTRLLQCGLKQLEVEALETDRELLCSLARCLAEDGPRADRMRTIVKALVLDEQPKPGGILAALRRSPLIGADLDLSRSRDTGREVEL